MPDVSSQTVIQIKDVMKTYHVGDVATPALRGVDLEIRRGEMFMIVGPSGCGKTTLLSILSATLKPDSGSVQVLDRDIVQADSGAAAAFRSKHIGFVFQQFNLIPTITVWENVSVPLLIQGVSLAEAKERSFSLLARLGLENRARLNPNRLSGGQQQRVAIARALVHEPEIIVCDEPTSALDGHTGEEILIQLDEMTRRAKKSTVVLVTHDSRIFHFADRIAEMEDGHIVRHRGPG